MDIHRPIACFLWGGGVAYFTGPPLEGAKHPSEAAKQPSGGRVWEGEPPNPPGYGPDIQIIIKIAGNST